MIAPHSEAAAPTSNNPGETLRAARESKNWSLQSVAQQLNLSERSLTRIEAGDFSQLPGHTFARGYVRAYAKLLGLDQNRLVQEFDQHTGTDASGSDVNSLGHIDQPVRLSPNTVRVFVFALLLVLVGAAFYWWQERATINEPGAAVTALERIEVEAADGTTEIHLLDRAEAPLGGIDQGGEAADLLAADREEAAAEAEDESQRVTAEPETAAVPASTETPVAEAGTAAEPESAADVAQGSGPLALAPGEGRLELQYTADCWTRVIDADGRVLFSSLVKAGATHTVTGKAPLDLHLGYAPGVKVTYNGEAVSLADNTRGETARLKLGQ